MNQGIRIGLISSLLAVIITATIVLEVKKYSTPARNKPLQVVIDVLNINQSQIMRFADCSTSIICYSVVGSISCAESKTEIRRITDKCD